jgi:ATPase subunit of ABC transporter with duplicated ATPase domains
MGQNGSGKSTIIKMLTGDLSPDAGKVNITNGETIAVAKQTMPVEARDLTIEEYFASQFTAYNDPGPQLCSEIAKVLMMVDLDAPLERIVKSFSGGQQARLLLAAALITDPSILLLDEPTNNLDTAGIDHLRQLIVDTDKTCLVISHDEAFLNSFTDAVLYLDIFSKTVETYNGDYLFVKSEIEKRRIRENRANASMAREAKKKKDQAGVFANKGGGMRKVAKRMRAVAEDMTDSLIDVRREDEALKHFNFPCSFRKNAPPLLMSIGEITSRCPTSGEMVSEKLESGAVELTKGSRLHVCGPNGIGKTTWLELIAKGTAPGVKIARNTTVGYYRQDFHNFDFNATVLACLDRAGEGAHNQQSLRATAGAFMLKGDIQTQRVATLSEGQKALMSLACLVLQGPSVLIMDEPTNHVNFRHLPSLAAAVKNFEGAVIMVSHDSHFMGEVGIEKKLDMGYELGMGKTETPGGNKKKGKSGGVLSEEARLDGKKGGKKSGKKSGKKDDGDDGEADPFAHLTKKERNQQRKKINKQKQTKKVPTDWVEYKDEASGQAYWYSQSTGESSYEEPRGVRGGKGRLQSA